MKLPIFANYSPNVPNFLLGLGKVIRNQQANADDNYETGDIGDENNVDIVGNVGKGVDSEKCGDDGKGNSEKVGGNGEYDGCNNCNSVIGDSEDEEDIDCDGDYCYYGDNNDDDEAGSGDEEEDQAEDDDSVALKRRRSASNDAEIKYSILNRSMFYFENMRCGCRENCFSFITKCWSDVFTSIVDFWGKADDPVLTRLERRGKIFQVLLRAYRSTEKNFKFLFGSQVVCECCFTNVMGTVENNGGKGTTMRPTKVWRSCKSAILTGITSHEDYVAHIEDEQVRDPISVKYDHASAYIRTVIDSGMADCTAYAGNK
jgi:hypothetical protein